MDEVKIGVGVITMGIRPLKDYKLSEDSDLFIYTDTEKKGPAYARNQALKHFKDYDHIFIYDDDAYPVRVGWEQYFIEQAEKYQISYMALPEVFGGELLVSNNEMTYWHSALGCFIYQNKKCMETIGGYNTEYDRYGFEDAGRSRRGLKAGLTGHSNGWGFPLRGLCYIHSEDVFWENPTPNISAEDKKKYIEKNGPIYAKEVNSEQLFYPYE